tara:strand:- start:108 stop:611 length:504 start_codon:yes stop_codon:yes gene_type:complete
MAAPNPINTTSGNAKGDVFQQTTCSSADTWTTLIPSVTLPTDAPRNINTERRKLGKISFHYTGLGLLDVSARKPIKFGVRIYDKVIGDSNGCELILVYEDYVSPPDKRMSDVDIIQGLDNKGYRTYDFSDLDYLWTRYELQYYSSEKSGYIINTSLRLPDSQGQRFI